MTSLKADSLPALISGARRALEVACSFAEVKVIRDKAEAMRVLARSISAGTEAQNRCAELKLRAERRLGEELAKAEMHPAGRPAENRSHDVTDLPPTLSDLGITRMQSSRWQAVARVPEEMFEDYVADAAEITTAGALKIEKMLRTRSDIAEGVAGDTCTVADLSELVRRGLKFGTIYADPPWLYDNQGTRAATSNHYDGLTVDQLCELPVGELTAPDAHLHLWTTNAFLFDCQRIMAAWGFEFRSTFAWVKPQMGIGNYWRNSHELMLTGIRGDAKRFNDKSLMSWLLCDRGAHSSKPEQVRTMLEKASPGPRLELFGRRPADGWTVWGNQIERGLFYRDVPEVAA